MSAVQEPEASFGALVTRQLEALRTAFSQQLAALRDGGPGRERAEPIPQPGAGALPATPTAPGVAFIERYTRRTAGSKRLAQRHRRHLADPRAASGFRRSIKELVYPIAAARSQAGRFWDVDGNEYVDLAMGFGTLLFGHRSPLVLEAIEAQLVRGIHVGPQNALAGPVAERICALTGAERAAFTVTGSEAVMAALRLARTRTGRSKVALCAGSYHGINDGTLVMAGRDARGRPMAPGIPRSTAAEALVLPYGTPEALDAIEAHADDLAAVLVEPVQSRRPGLQPRDHLRALRELTRRRGVPLVFDEVLTGFRVHPRGAAGWFEVEPDLSTYGKVVAGGLPIGVVAGRRELLDGVDGGYWSFGDDSYPVAAKTYLGSTYAKHPLVLPVADAVLRELAERSPELQRDLNAKAGALARDLNREFERGRVPIGVAHFGSLLRFEFGRNQDLFFYELIARGVYVWEQRTCFLSTAHTQADLDHVVRAVRESIESLGADGALR